MYYRVCPDCKAHLDPDEKCDCKKKEADLRAQTEPQAKLGTPSLPRTEKPVKRR